MSTGIPTDEDFQRIEAAMSVRIRAGERVRDEIEEMISEEAAKAVKQIMGERVEDLESTATATGRALGQVRTDLALAMERLARLEEAHKASSSSFDALSSRLTALEDQVARVRTDHESMASEVKDQAAGLGAHTAQIQGLRDALDTLERNGGTASRRLDALTQELENTRAETRLANEQVRQELGKSVAQLVDEHSQTADKLRQEFAEARAEASLATKRVHEDLGKSLSRLGDEQRRASDDLRGAILAAEGRIAVSDEASAEERLRVSSEFGGLRQGLEVFQTRLSEMDTTWQQELRTVEARANDRASKCDANIVTLGQRFDERVRRTETTLAARAEERTTAIERSSQSAKVRDVLILLLSLIALAAALLT